MDDSLSSWIKSPLFDTRLLCYIYYSNIMYVKLSIYYIRSMYKIYGKVNL